MLPCDNRRPRSRWRPLRRTHRVGRRWRTAPTLPRHRRPTPSWRTCPGRRPRRPRLARTVELPDATRVQPRRHPRHQGAGGEARRRSRHSPHHPGRCAPAASPRSSMTRSSSTPPNLGSAEDGDLVSVDLIRSGAWASAGPGVRETIGNLRSEKAGVDDRHPRQRHPLHLPTR